MTASFWDLEPIVGAGVSITHTVTKIDGDAVSFWLSNGEEITLGPSDHPNRVIATYKGERHEIEARA